MTIDNLSPYAECGPTLVELGYSAIPCMPGSKIPGRWNRVKWVPMSGWADYCNTLPTSLDYRRWVEWPGAGICLCCGNGLIAVDIDTEDREVLEAIESILPGSPVRKIGSKGYTVFFYDPKGAIASRKFKAKGAMAIEVLAGGRQTVIPPTIHPDAGRPYRWVGAGLENYRPDELPDDLPADFSEQIESVLEKFQGESANGVAQPGPRKESKKTPKRARPSISTRVENDHDETVWSDLNAAALDDFDAWVPALKLPKCKRKHNGNYEAVAFWRESSSGRDLSKRNPNLGFSRSGVRDFGVDQSYSPLDVVCAALDVELEDAYEWLKVQVQVEPPQLPDLSALNGAIAGPNPLLNTLGGAFARLESGALNARAGEIELKKPKDYSEAPPSGGGTPVERVQVQPDFDARLMEDCPGLVGDIARWINESARTPIPVFSLMGAVAYCSAVFGRRYLSPTRLATNLYVMALGRAGTGKEHILAAMKELDEAIGGRFVGPEQHTSDSAVEKTLARMPSCVLVKDEIGIFLQGVNTANSPLHVSNIRSLLLNIYSKSNNVYTGKEYADPKMVPQRLVMPNLSIYGTSTPDEFYEGITERNLKDGMVARLLVALNSENIRPKNRDELSPLKAPKELVARLGKVLEARPDIGNLAAPTMFSNSHMRPPTIRVKWTDGAKEICNELEDWQFDLGDRVPEVAGVIGRCAEMAQKLAMIRAIGRDYVKPDIDEYDMQWGVDIARYSAATVDRSVMLNMASSPHERSARDALAYIKAAGGEGIPFSKLKARRGLSKLNDWQWKAAEKELEEREWIWVRRAARTGRKGARYFAAEFAPRLDQNCESIGNQ